MPASETEWPTPGQDATLPRGPCGRLMNWHGHGQFWREAGMTTVIDDIGGEDTVRALVERFYDLIETLPEGADILDLHFQGHGLGHVRAEQFAFLCGFFGGRRHYAEVHGHMDLRAIHAHVPIRDKDATNWLFCMARALEDTAVHGPARGKIDQTFARAARMLVNRPDEAE